MDETQCQAYVDNKIDLAFMSTLSMIGYKTLWEKQKIAGYQYFSPMHKMLEDARKSALVLSRTIMTLEESKTLSHG